MMEEEALRPTGLSTLSIAAAVCAALVLFFNFCMVNVVGGELMIMFHVPLQFGEGANIVNIVESLLTLTIPVVMGVFIFFFMKKNAIMLCLPLILYLLRLLVKTAYLCLYEGRFTLTETWQDLLIFTLLSVVFALTVLGKINTGWWLTGICGLLILMEMLELVIPAAVSDFAGGLSIYLSNFFTAALFFLGYGILGLMMDQKIRKGAVDELGKEKTE